MKRLHLINYYQINAHVAIILITRYTKAPKVIGAS